MPGSGGCDFHADFDQDCVHCLGYALAVANADITRLHDWIRHLTERSDRPQIVSLVTNVLLDIRGQGLDAMNATTVEAIAVVNAVMNHIGGGH